MSNIGSATIFSTDGTVNYLHSVYDSQNEKVIVSYKTSTSNKGYSSVGSSKITTTNLTSENYIGIAAEAISDGATGKINVPTESTKVKLDSLLLEHIMFKLMELSPHLQVVHQ